MPPDPITPPPKDTPLEPTITQAQSASNGAGASADASPESILEPEKTAPSSENFGHEQQPEAQNEPDLAPEPTAEPVQIPNGSNGGNEPLKPEPIPLEPTVTQVQPASNGTRSLIQELLFLAGKAVQSRKRKKLEKILGLLEKRTSITNDEVEKLLHVSDATATRYLSTLEKEGKIKQTGKTGKSVSYSKI